MIACKLLNQDIFYTTNIYINYNRYFLAWLHRAPGAYWDTLESVSGEESLLKLFQLDIATALYMSICFSQNQCAYAYMLINVVVLLYVQEIVL